MAQEGVQLGQETISCLMCQDPLKDPVTIPCGHSYCMDCIKTHWDEEDERRIYSCLQCTKTFTPRPVLVKNIMLAALVEELKKTGLQAAPADHCYAGPEDVACDVCTGRKLKALKSCLVCLVSYCEKHLQPHFESPAFEIHKLIEPSKRLQELDTVSAATERTERQRELEVCRRNIQQRIQDREKDVKVLQQEVEAISRSADKVETKRADISNQLMYLMASEMKRVKQQIRSHQETEVSRVKELQEKLQQEITELKRKDAELEKLSHTEDHNQFLHNYPSLSRLSESTDSSSINIRQQPLNYFEDLTAAVSAVGDKALDLLHKKWSHIPEVDVLLSQPQPKTRAEFFQYSSDITLDPNTANVHLLLSEGNRKVTVMRQHQPHPYHPDRFTECWQVLSRESLTGRCYWEVEWRGRRGGVYVVVAYKNISRSGRSNECRFGCNDKSWAFRCSNRSFHVWHNVHKYPIFGPLSSRVGVYLDPSLGILSLYSVAEMSMTLLHKMKLEFTQPLHVGLGLSSFGDSAEICKLKYPDGRDSGL